MVKFAPNQTARSVLSENRFSEMNVKIKEHYPNVGVFLLSYEDPSRTNREVLKRVIEDSRIKSVQFNYQVTLRSTIPSDEYFGNQWSLRNTGQSGGTAGADIAATDAWDITTGVSGITALNDEIIVSVVDGGFDLDHQDLNFTNLVYNVELDSEDQADMPVENHGTAIAGIIGAHGNNEDGVSGVGWNTKILPIGDIYNPSSTIYENNVIASYEYILGLRKQYNQTKGQEGLYIVATNSSFGLDSVDSNYNWHGSDPQFHQAWCDSYDSLGVHGILSVVATANADVDIDQELDVPSACSSDYLISVTNTDHDDEKYHYAPTEYPGAAWGETTIDLGAPGESIFTTIVGGYDDEYGGFPISGTSFATPHVAGAVALIYNILPEALLTYYQNNPAQAALDVKDAILNSVVPLPSLQGSTPTVSGGRLDVFNALKYIIENHGADLGRGMNEVVFTDEMTIQNSDTKLTLNSGLVLSENLNLASGASLIFEANNTVTIEAAGGTITIGGQGESRGAIKIAGDIRSGYDYSGHGINEIEEKGVTPDQFMLTSNYPNPFNPTTTISYKIPVSSPVTLKVFDILGREVATLVDGIVLAGQHEVQFDASNLSTGLYIYRLQAGENIKTKTMMLVK